MNVKTLQLNGMELLDPNAEYSGEQVIYLDFNGANNVSYDNAALNITVDGINVADSGLDQARINKIITELNTTYAGSGVTFTVTLPDSSLITHHSSPVQYSTIYVGSAGSAFAQYGNFLGLSETIDGGNQIKTDNAYVFSDKITSTDQLTDIIAHEAGHLIGFEHNTKSDNSMNSINNYAISGDITSVTSSLNNFRFIAGSGISDLFNTFSATVSTGATQVAFEVGGQTIWDTNGNDGWSVKVNMSDCINTNDLVVKSYASSTLLDTYNVDVNLLMLPNWLQKANAHIEKVSATSDNGYSISIKLEDFNKEVFTPDDWKWNVPYFNTKDGKPLLDISNLRTGIDGGWYLTIKSDANGAVSITDSEYYLGMEVLGQKIIDKKFKLSGGTSSGANYSGEWQNANITVDASGNFNIAFGPNIDNNLQLTDGASCSTQLNMAFDTKIQLPSFSLTEAAAGVPSWLASIDGNLAYQIGVDFNLQTTGAFSIKDGFYLSNATIDPSMNFHAILTGEANVLNGVAAKGGITLDAYVIQHLKAQYIKENPTPWVFTAPGSLNLDSKLYWDTFLTDPGNKDLFSLKLAEWDFLNQASTPDPNNVNQEYLAPGIGSVTPSSTNITQRQKLVIAANNVTGTDIAYVEFSVNGNVIACDKDATDGWSFSANTTQTGTYTFSAQAYNNFGIASNKVAASQVKINTAGDTFEPNNTPTQATDLGVVEGNLYLSKDLGLNITSGDVDYYKFTITSTGTKNDSVTLYMKYSDDATGTRDLDLAIGKFNNSNRWCPIKGEWFDSWSATDSREEKISLEGLGADTYYAIVYGATATNNYYNNYPGDKVLHFEQGVEANTYSLIINAPMIDSFENDNDWQNAKSITLDGVKQIHSMPGGDHDWIKFTLRDVYDININLSAFADKSTGEGLAGIVDLYKANNDNSGFGGSLVSKTGADGTALKINQRLSAGTYYIEINTNVNNDIGQYDISVTGAVVNHSPVVANPVADQILSSGDVFKYIIPDGTFEDIDNDTLSISVSQEDDSALPAWLTFDQSTKTLSGTPIQDGSINIKVIANDGNGNSAYDIFALTIKTLPAGPTGLSVEFDENRNIKFKWTASTNMTSDHYVFTLFDADGNPITSDLQSDETSILRESPKPGEFTWHVKAVDAAGNESAWSQNSSFTVDVNNYLPVPKDVVQNLEGNQVAFNWSDVNHATKYEIQVDTHSDFGNTLDLYNSPSISEMSTTLADGTYNYRVRASNEYGTSAWSDVKSFTVEGNFSKTVIYASDAAANSYFGLHAAVSGDIIATVGDNYYIYRWDGTKWNETKFTPDAGNGKIYTVATSDNTVVIGNSVNASIYRWNGTTWGESIITQNTGFAHSVAITGDTVAVSAEGDSNYTGAAYIYQWNGSAWINSYKLTAADKAEGDDFGYSIAAYGNTMIVGAPGDDDKGQDSGSVYVYQQNGTSWDFVQKLTASDEVADDRFGRNVAISSNLIVSWADNDNSNGVYAYRKNGSGWDETKFSLEGYNSGKVSLAASGNTFVVGGLSDSDDLGCVLTYHWNGTAWDKSTLTGYYDVDGYSKFGTSVSISGDSVVIGESGNDAFGAESGCVYVYKLDLGDTAFTPIVSSQTVTGETVSNGTQSIVKGGIANSGTISTNGYQNISSGGVTNATTINGGLQAVSSGGVANSTTVNNGDQTVLSGGVANSTTINPEGAQLVSSGGVANFTTISGGGQTIFAGGVANSTVINSGGLLVYADGVTNFTTINDGKQSIWSGVANSTTINSSGIQDIFEEGVADSTTINSGGSLAVFDGGMASNTTINSGGYQDVENGGTARNTVVNSGGSIYVSSGGSVTGGLTVAGGHVVLDNAASVSSLTTLSYALSTANINDVLVTVNGGILGAYATAYSLNLNNTAKGSYILADGVNLSGMNGKTFSVTDNGQTVNLAVGSSYTFGNGNKLSLNFADSTRDQLTAVISVADIIPPTVPADLKQTVTGSSVAFDWADATDATSGVKQYELQVDNNADFSSPEYSGHVVVSQASKESLSLGTYYWQVRSQDNSGNYSAWSKTASFIVTPTDTVGNTPATAGTLDVNSFTTEFVGFGDAADYYKLTILNNGTLSLNLTGLSGDANLALLDWAGIELNTSVNLGTADELINSVALLAGTYYVKVAPADGGIGTVNTDYTLSNTFINDAVPLPAITIATIDVAAGEPADTGTFRIYRTGDTANALTVKFNVSGDARQRGQIYLTVMDYYDYELKQGSSTLDNSVTIAAGQSSVDVTLGVIDDAIVEGAETAILNLTANAAYSLGSATSGTINITDNDADPGNTPGTARVWDVNDASTERVGLGDAADYYKLALDRAGKLSLNLTGLTGDANMTLYDAKYKSLKSSSLKGLADENINLSLPGGDYYVKIAPGSGVNDASYTLSNTVDYFPEDTASNTRQTAKDINEGVDDWVGFGDAADYYKLTLDSAGKLSLNLADLTGDASMTLYDAKGKSLKSSALKGLADENINLSLLGGDYYVKIASGSGVNEAVYTLSNIVDYFPDDTIGNTFAAAGVLDANGFADERVGLGDAADYYKLTLDSAGKLSLNLTSLTGDANLTLYDARYKSLKSSFVKGLADENIANLSLAGGNYYIKIAPGAGVNDASYTLSNTVDYFPEDTAGKAFAFARPVTENGQVDEWLGFGDKDDYYMFELQTATTVNLDLTDMSSNVNMYLYDSKSRQLAASAKSGNTDESISKTLAAGKYYVKATLAGKENTDYSLNFGIDPAAFKPGSLLLSGAASPLTGGADASQTDPLKKINGLLAS